MLSASHTPLKQRTDTPAAHVPLLGIASPVSALSLHVCAVVSHHCVAVQSSSALQPSAGRQVPVVEHAPLRQTVVDVIGVQAPVSFA